MTTGYLRFAVLRSGSAEAQLASSGCDSNAESCAKAREDLFAVCACVESVSSGREELQVKGQDGETWAQPEMGPCL